MYNRHNISPIKYMIFISLKPFCTTAIRVQRYSIIG